MNIVIPWIAIGLAAAGIAVYGTWGRKKRRERHNENRAKFVNPRKAA
jgi:hypothetical protein